MADLKEDRMNGALFDQKTTLVASLVGLFIGTIIVGMLGLTFSGHMQMANTDPPSIALR